MSRSAKEIFQNVKENVQAVAPGLSFSNILHDVGAELKQQAAHGAHEAAAALFTGNAFVMYPRTGGDQVDGPQQGASIEPLTQPEVQKEEQSQGLEM